MSKRLLSQIISLAANPAVSGDNPPITDNLILYASPDEAYSDTGNTLAEHDDNIRQVNDLSVSANNLEQATASSQPILKTDVFPNGVKAIYTPSDYMSFTNTINFPNEDDYFTIYLVLKKVTAGTHYYALTNESFLGRSELQTDSMDLLSSVGSRRVADYLVDDNGTDLRAYTFTLDRTQGAIGEFKGYLNGVFQGQELSSQINTNFILEYTRAYYGAGYYGDILIYNSAHTASQVTETYNWLNEKYSITA